MFTVWEWVILIIVIGLVSTFETLMIGSMAAKIFEAKAKATLEYETKYWDKFMDRFEGLVNKFIKFYMEMDEKQNTTTIRQIGFENESEK